MAGERGQWVRTDIDFGNPLAWVCVSNRTAMARTKLSLPSLVDQESVEMIEKVVYDLIEELRPEWSGGVIFAVRYSIYWGSWEILYAHRSFPKNPNGSDYPRVSIIPGEQFIQ